MNRAAAALLVILALLLASCGQRGPLHFPDDPDAPGPAIETDETEDD